MAAGDSHRQLQVPRNHPRSRRDVGVSREPQQPDELQRLQTTVGNRGMQQLLGGVRGLVGEGTPLPAALRAEHEQRFGADLADVRVHNHASAHRLADGQLARAFTLGRDIVFNREFYRPGTLAGRRLIAHELAHVVQQGAGGAGRASGPAHEAAADAAAQAAVSGTLAPVHAGPAAAIGIQCEPLSAAEIARLDQEQLRARMQGNEKEAEFMMNSEEYNQRLYRENLELKRQIQAKAKLQGSVAAAATGPDPAVTKVLESINAELTELTPLVARVGTDVLLNPADHALNEVRNLDARVRGDEKVVREFEPLAGGMASEVHRATIRFQVLQQMLAPAVAAATAWHDANPAGESLGMMNERAGTWLAGAGSEQWDKGGLHYVPGALAFVGAFGVAFVDAGEKLASMGFHDAATAVSQAYTRGDISWNEGESILHKAAWRALLIAAVTRGAGMATSRLGVLGAEATGLASTTLRYGFVAGAIPGGLSATAALGVQAVLTKGLEDEFNSPAAKAIWNQGMPQGKDWAIAIPMGIVMGGLGGMRGVELANDKLVGSIINTPEGPMKIVTITKLKFSVSNGKVGVTQPGLMVLQPVGGSLVAVPPPPLTDLVMTFDPLTNSWVYPKAAPTGLATVRLPKPAVPSGGSAMVPVQPTGGTPALSGTPANALANASGPALAGALPKPALPAAQPTKGLAAPKAPQPLSETPGATVPSPPVVIPPAPKLPVTPNTARAAQRLAQTEVALASANNEANLARAKVAKAQADLDAANELASEAGGGKDAKALVKGAEADLRRAQAGLKPLERSEAAALQERDAVARGGAELTKIEQEIAALDEQIKNELNPPGGFSREQISAGRRGGMVPPTGTPDGRPYHDLVIKRARTLKRLQTETEGLTRSLSDQVAAATPGATARPTALANAAQLEPALRPIDGKPIDVTTGQPMNTADWATDHIMSRSEIARDPRFARLTPLQRDAILLEVPENYLPLTPEANSSKLNLSVDDWIAARAANGKPLPTEIVKALRAADVRARAAIEAMFNRFLSP